LKEGEINKMWNYKWNGCVRVVCYY